MHNAATLLFKAVLCKLQQAQLVFAKMHQIALRYGSKQFAILHDFDGTCTDCLPRVSNCQQVGNVVVPFADISG